MKKKSLNKKLDFKEYILKIFKSYWIFLFFAVLLAAQIFMRFSFPETKSGFGWDQTDNAWAAKSIIVDHKFPLVGMQAKGNTGFYIGPYYYYLITPFYLATNLDPAASVIIAGLTSLLTFFLIFFLIKDIFNEKVAVLALFIHVCSIYIINLDRVQWPVDFIVPISLLIFYSLFKILNGNYKYLLLLTGAFGFSLHIHFTSIFYIVLIFLALPFFPRKKEAVKYILYSIPILVFFMFPILISTLSQGNSKAFSYVGSTFLGVHLTRILQVAKDGFIEFEEIVNLKIGVFKYVGFILFPLYLFILLRKKSKKDFSIFYLSFLWIIIPWLAFSTYNGEITNYYFLITRPAVLMALAYLLYRIWNTKKIYSYFFVGLIIAIYSYSNLIQFLDINIQGLAFKRADVLGKIKKGEVINFTQGDPNSYLYYIYKERFNKK